MLIDLIDIVFHSTVIVISTSMVVISRSNLLVLFIGTHIFTYFVLEIIITLLNCRVTRLRLILGIFVGDILWRAEQRLLHAERVIKGVVLILLVGVLAWNFVENFGIKKYLVRSLRQQNILLIVLVLEKQTATVAYGGLLLHDFLHLHKSLFACPIIYDHRTACVSVVHAEFISEVLRSSLTQHLVIVGWRLFTFSLDSSESFHFSLVIVLLLASPIMFLHWQVWAWSTLLCLALLIHLLVILFTELPNEWAIEQLFQFFMLPLLFLV